jgi:hypothetical protein
MLHQKFHVVLHGGFGKKRRRSGLLLLAYDSSTNLMAKLILTPNMFSIIYFAMFVASV